MILLIPEVEDNQWVGMECRHVRLVTLLTDLGTGHAPKADRIPVFRDPYAHQQEDSPVVLLRMGHFLPEDDAIDWVAVAADMPAAASPLERELIERREVLEPDDLLLSLRGQPRLIRICRSSLEAMPLALLERGVRLAPTNNFILLRPHPQLVYVPFLQLLLEVLLEEVMSEWHAVLSDRASASPLGAYLKNKYEERAGSSRSPGIPIGIRELKELMVSIPTDQSVQIRLYQHHKQMRDEAWSIKTRIRNFRTRLTEFTNPTIPL